MSEKKKYRRRTHYPGHLGASVTYPTQRAVEELADEADWSIAEAIRECIEAGLPVVKSRLTSNGDSPSDPADDPV